MASSRVLLATSAGRVIIVVLLVCTPQHSSGLNSKGGLGAGGPVFGTHHRVLFLGDFLSSSSADGIMLAALDGMEIVEDTLELQVDEVGSDDVIAQLYNFMPDLVMLSAVHLMYDPLPLAPRLQAIRAAASELGVVTVGILGWQSDLQEEDDAFHAAQIYKNWVPNVDFTIVHQWQLMEHLLDLEMQSLTEIPASQPPAWFGYGVRHKVCHSTRSFLMQQQQQQQPQQKQEIYEGNGISSSAGERGGRMGGGDGGKLEERGRIEPRASVLVYVGRRCLSPAVRAALDLVHQRLKTHFDSGSGPGKGVEVEVEAERREGEALRRLVHPRSLI